MAVLFPPQNETFFKQAACQYVASLSSMPEFMTQVIITLYVVVWCTSKPLPALGVVREKQ